MDGDMATAMVVVVTAMDAAAMATDAVGTVTDVAGMPPADGLDTVAQDAPDTAAHGLGIAVVELTDTLEVARLAADLAAADTQVGSAVVVTEVVVAAMAAADTGNS
jgi:hypothetical protein